MAYLVMGKDDKGNVIRIALTDTGETTSDGEPLYALNVGRAAVEVTPVSQATTNPYVDVSGSQLDTLNTLAVSYTIVNNGAATIVWQVLASNDVNFASSVVAKAGADILTTASDTYSNTAATYRYYKVQVKSKVADTPGAALVVGITKG